MIVLRFLHDTPFDMFEGTYKLTLDLYGLCDVSIRYDPDIRHIVLRIYGDHTTEDIENDLAKYSHWFNAEESE